jgi:hypothetical protein
MHEHESSPRARKDGLLEETVGEELLLYDRNSHTAHCLSPIAAGVWQHCDDEHDTTELAELAGASESLVADALHELHEKDLLAAEPTLTESAVPGLSRREAIGRAARYGAAAAAGSLIVSATAATPAAVASPGATCCQCFANKDKTGTRCACTTHMSEDDCNEWCSKRTGCLSGLLTGTTCGTNNTICV